MKSLASLILAVLFFACSTEQSTTETSNVEDSVKIESEINTYDSLSREAEEAIQNIEESANELDQALENLEN